MRTYSGRTARVSGRTAKRQVICQVCRRALTRFANRLDQLPAGLGIAECLQRVLGWCGNLRPKLTYTCAGCATEQAATPCCQCESAKKAKHCRLRYMA